MIVEILGLIAEKHYQKALEMVKKDLEGDPENYDLNYALAVISDKMGSPDKALEIVESLISRGANDEKLKVFHNSLRSANTQVHGEFHESKIRKENYLVSAIVSTYKSEKFIRQALENLTEQTLFQKGQLEIVIVNSDSPENEHSIILDFIENHPHTVYLKTPERETIYKAWNRAIKLSRGTLITNANTDDRPKIDGMEFLANLLQANPECALAYGDSVITRNENKKFQDADIIGHFRWPDFSRRRLFEVCYIGPSPMWKKDLHNTYGYFSESFKSAGDYEFWLRICGKEKFIHTEKVIGLYLYADTSVEHQNAAVSEKESASAREKYWDPKWGNRPQPNGTYLTNGNHPLFTNGPLVAHGAPNSGTVEKNPLVSVIIPTYNRPKMLEKAIQSVLQQSYSPIEIIVINDGGEFIEEIIKNFNSPNIIYCRVGKNAERSCARNRGLQLARGKYIAYLDDDDCYFPEHIVTLVTYLENNNAPVAYTDAKRAQQILENQQYKTISTDIPYSRDFDNELILINNFIPTLCIMHLKECIDEVGLFDESLKTHEDWDMWIRISRKFTFHHIKSVTCEFSSRDDGSSTTSSKKDDFKATRKIIYDKYRNFANQSQKVVEGQNQILAQETHESNSAGLKDEGMNFLKNGISKMD